MSNTATQQIKFSAVFVFLLNVAFIGAEAPILIPADNAAKSDFNWSVSGMFRPESFYGSNINLFNSTNECDKTFYARHILDLNVKLLYGQKTYEYDVAQFYITVRNRSTWGNPNSIASTTFSEPKLVNGLTKAHNHAIPRLFFWMRECWLNIDLIPLTGLGITNKHTLQIGGFPFQLGRGIALGDAYATGAGVLGFYTDSIVDQYAFGAKLTGEIMPGALTYDFYTAILQNKSSGFGDTCEDIYANALGRLDCPERGFGHINFVTAARLLWTAFDNKLGRLNFEPYALYNNDSEQKIEFLGDADSKLATIGLAAEYEGDVFQLGFDYAQNLGRQNVKGWDRNQVIYKNVGGAITEVNSQVFVGSATGSNATFVKNSPVQSIILDSRQDEALSDGSLKEQQNGQFIGTVPATSSILPDALLYNGPFRFRNAYTNIYQGRMFVADAAVWAYKKDLQLAVTAGFASGDENPNFQTKDGIYDGFIPLQQIYSGKRVRSAFVLGGAGKIKRPLSSPTNRLTPNRFAINVDGFTNLVFTGCGFNYTPKEVTKKYTVNPNLLVFWEQNPTHGYDLATKSDSTKLESTYLGIEANMFFSYMVLKDCKLYLVASAFFPGTFYRDNLGRPLDSDQESDLEDIDVSGVDNPAIPNLGRDTAYTFNLGFDYRF